jgi:hypothetical protein
VLLRAGRLTRSEPDRRHGRAPFPASPVGINRTRVGLTGAVTVIVVIIQSYNHILNRKDRGFLTLAHHLTEAGLPEKAVSYWLKAGKNAIQRYANLEAIAHLQRGIETAGRLSEGPCLIATQGPASSTAMQPSLAVESCARASAIHPSICRSCFGLLPEASSAGNCHMPGR